MSILPVRGAYVRSGHICMYCVWMQRSPAACARLLKFIPEGLKSLVQWWAFGTSSGLSYQSIDAAPAAAGYARRLVRRTLRGPRRRGMLMAMQIASVRPPQQTSIPLRSHTALTDGLSPLNERSSGRLPSRVPQRGSVVHLCPTCFTPSPFPLPSAWPTSEGLQVKPPQPAAVGLFEMYLQIRQGNVPEGNIRFDWLLPFDEE